MTTLPAPSADALATSQALCRRIADAIRAEGGWIPFSRYMELALYAPGLGYYSAGSCKLGSAGDFTTAPEMSPFFGRTLARQLAQILPQTAGDLYEFGAGTGKLAIDILTVGRPHRAPAKRHPCSAAAPGRSRGVARQPAGSD